MSEEERRDWRRYYKSLHFSLFSTLITMRFHIITVRVFALRVVHNTRNRSRFLFTLFVAYVGRFFLFLMVSSVVKCFLF